MEQRPKNTSVVINAVLKVQEEEGGEFSSPLCTRYTMKCQFTVGSYISDIQPIKSDSKWTKVRLINSLKYRILPTTIPCCS